MNSPSRITVHAIVGLAVGSALVFIAAICSLLIALVTEWTVGIPGIISIWPTVENDARALIFDPNPLGMSIAAVAIAAVYGAVTIRRASRAA